MIRTILTVLLGSFSVISFSQDVLLLRNGSQLNVKDIEIRTGSVSFRYYSDTITPVHSVADHDLLLIRFENGRELPFDSKREKHQSFFSNEYNKYYSLGLGLGESYGGFGLRFQGRTGKVMGFGYHAGIGYSVSDLAVDYDGWLASAGVKFFWYKGWYVDLEYGPVANYERYVDGLYVTRTAWGPSFSFGGDWFVFRRLGINFGLGKSFNITQPTDDPDYRFSKDYVLFELGAFLKL